jgi:hypothetical protein
MLTECFYYSQRVDLFNASADGKGVLTTEDLEGFIKNLMPKLPGLLVESDIDIDPTLYSKTVAAKFLFFYGSQNRCAASVHIFLFATLI